MAIQESLKMTRTYYAISGSFSNALIVHAFASRKERDEWVDNRPDNSMLSDHFGHDAYACTRREAEALCASNRRRARDRQRYGAAYSDNYGTTELPVADRGRVTPRK